jgi:hypothetical protein
MAAALSAQTTLLHYNDSKLILELLSRIILMRLLRWLKKKLGSYSTAQHAKI